MVQTEQQYICIHQCLLAVLEGKENMVGPPREIHDNEGYEGKFYCDYLLLFLIFWLNLVIGFIIKTNKSSIMFKKKV